VNAHRTGGDRGRFRFDRVFKDVGRIWVTSGARTKREFKTLDRMLDRLFEAGQLEVLGMIRDGKLSPQAVRQAERSGRLRSDSLAADILLREPLWDREVGGKLIAGALSGTLDGMAIARASRERYETSFAQLKQHGGAILGAKATVADLARVQWKDVWTALASSSAGNRNRLRAAVSAILTVYLGGDLYHPFRRDVVKAMGKKEPEAKVVSDLTVAEFWTLMEHVPEVAVPCYVTLAASGLRVGEFLQAVSARRIEQTKGKRKTTLCAINFADGKTGPGTVYVAGEWWPDVSAAVPCRVAPAPKVFAGIQRDARYKRLSRWLADASEKTGIRVTIHYLRHLFVQEGVAELPESMVQGAARHKTPNMTRDYAMRSDRGEVARVVGRRLRAPAAPKEKGA